MLAGLGDILDRLPSQYTLDTAKNGRSTTEAHNSSWDLRGHIRRDDSGLRTYSAVTTALVAGSHISDPNCGAWTPFWSRPLCREEEISPADQLVCYCCIAQHSTLKTRDQILERSKNRIAPSGTIFRFPSIYLAERVGAPAMYRAAGSDGSSQVRVLVSDII